jgi:hypothetical protein
MPIKTPVLHQLAHWRPSCRGTMPSRVTTPWATTRHDKDALYAEVSQLHREWADACLTSSTPLAPQWHQYLVDGHSGRQGCHARQPLRTMGSQKQ